MIAYQVVSSGIFMRFTLLVTSKTRTVRLMETLELWWRDPVECVQELMGNQMFQNVMRYAPEKVFTDAGGKNELVSKMQTAEWWWKLQVRFMSHKMG